MKTVTKAKNLLQNPKDLTANISLAPCVFIVMWMTSLLVCGQWSFSSAVLWIKVEQRLTVAGIFIFYKPVRPITSKPHFHNSQLYWKSQQKKNNIEWIVWLSMGSPDAKMRSLWLYWIMFLQPHCVAPVILFQFCEKRELSTSYFLHIFVISLELYFKISCTKNGLYPLLACTQYRGLVTVATFIAGRQTINLNEQSRLFSRTYKIYIYSIHMLG